MSELISAGIISGNPASGLAWFAKESEQDLEFDEGLEDDDSLQPKPPSRRPLIWILVLLVVVAGVYWILQPTSSTQTSKSTPTISEAPSVTPPSPPTVTKPVVPPPLFHEKQRVVLASATDDQHQTITLSGDATGTTPGPSIQAGETVTVLDGAFVGQQWVYQVRTPSGSTGWVPEDKLKLKS